jgi:hypothetical protein
MALGYRKVKKRGLRMPQNPMKSNATDSTGLRLFPLTLPSPQGEGTNVRLP